MSTHPKSSDSPYRRFSEMNSKKHSILSVFNAHADVERTMREHSYTGFHIRSDCIPSGNECVPHRIAEFFETRNQNTLPKSRVGSWGVLFGSEYIWAPDIGPMLIVCQCKSKIQLGPQAGPEWNGYLENCSILQFETKFSTHSLLRIFHGY